MQMLLVLGYIFFLEEKKIHKRVECISIHFIKKKNLLRQQIDTVLTEISNIYSLLGRDSTEPPLQNQQYSRAH